MTCLCITRDRRQWLPKAIACFQEQKLLASELLIVADGTEVQDLVPRDDERIRLIHLEGISGVGAKRNFGCEHAAGKLIAHWDDDDYSAPERLMQQVFLLHNTGKMVTGYKSMRFTDGENWWQFTGEINYAVGTSLCYHRKWWQKNQFLHIQVGEDNDFVRRAWDAGELVTVNAGEMMHATIHTGNTSPRNKNDSWTRIERA